MLMYLYQLDHKRCKWYCRIFFWVLNVVSISGWLLYCLTYSRRVAVRDQLILLDCRASISEKLFYE